MAEGVSTIFMMPDLSRCNDEQARFDCARAKKHVPVGLAGRNRERRGHGDDIGSALCEPSEQAREAQVVTNGQAEFADRRSIHKDYPLPGGINIGFAPALACWQVDIEQVDLVIARADLALAVDDEPAVGDIAALRQHSERSEVKPDTVPARGLAARGEQIVLSLVTQARGRASGVAIEQSRHFGREKDFRAVFDPTQSYVAPKAEPPAPYLNFAPLQNSLARLQESTKNYQAAMNAPAAQERLRSRATEERLDEILRGVEHSMTRDAGLPRRPWFKHQIYAPGFYTGYGVKTLPGVREAVEQHNWKEAEAEVAVVAGAIERAAAEIDRATALLQGGR